MGTYRLSQEAVEPVVDASRALGYKMIDTASVYRNEQGVGNAITRAIHSGKITRQDLFITSKIGPKDQGLEKSYKAIQTSLLKLGSDVGYLDLMLIHWPGTQSLKLDSLMNKMNRANTWNSLVRARDEGLVRAIGVSNYTLEHLKEVDPPPQVNQIEFHPLVYDDTMKRLLEYCHAHNIIVQSYSTLAEGKLVNGSWELPELVEMARQKGVTQAQILFRWSMNKGCPIIPKSAQSDRLKENLASLSIQLSEEVFCRHIHFVGDAYP